MKWIIDKYIFRLAIFIIMSLQIAFAQTPARNNAIMLRQAAQMYERAGQYQQAANYYSRACLDNPSDMSAYLGAKRMLVRLQDYENLQKLILSLQKQRRDIRYLVDLAFIDYKQGDEKSAVRAWGRILEENPKSQQAYSLVGQAMIENQLYEQAVKVYSIGRSNLKNATAFTFELASIYQALSDFDALVQEYADYLTSNPAQVTFIRSEIQRIAGEDDARKSLIKELQKRIPKNKTISWALHLFLGDLSLMDKKYKDALDHFLLAEKSMTGINDKRIKASYKKGGFVYACGEAALNANSPEEAEKAFLAVIHDFADGPFRAKAELGLTQVYLQRKSYEEAILSLERFIKNNKKSHDSRRALLMIGDISFHNLFQIERAERAYKRAYAEYPNNRFQIEALFKLADCAIALDSLDVAESYLHKAETRAKGRDADLKKTALLGLARMAFYRARPHKSLEQLQHYSQLAGAGSKADVFENDALELMITVQENIQDSTSLAVLGRSRLLAFQRKYAKADSLLLNYLQNNPTVLLRSEMRLQLSEMYQARGNYDAALAVLLAVYADGESLYRDAALMKAGDILETKLSDVDLATEKYETVLVEFPNSVYLEQARNRIRALRTLKENL